MLGGNAEFLAKNDLRKAGLSDELIAEATGFAETENEEILNARKLFSEAEAKYKAAHQGRRRTKVRAAGGLFILGTERHESAASTTSSGPRWPTGRPRRPGSTCPWRTISCACSARAGRGHDGEAGCG